MTLYLCSRISPLASDGISGSTKSSRHTIENMQHKCDQWQGHTVKNTSMKIIKTLNIQLMIQKRVG